MKSVNFKKIASLVLAVTLVLSIIAPVPAAAAELKQAAEAELSVEQKLEEQKPEEQKSEEEKPEEQKPEEEKPEEEKPEEQQPEEEKPEEQQPEAEEPKKIEAGAMQADAERSALDENGGFYFTMDKNDIPVNEDVDEDGNSLAWNNTFAPTADDCIVIIRGEEEIRVGIPENAVLVKYSETGYYLKTASGEEKLLADALKPGDVIVIRGDFTNGNTTFTVAESLIFVGEDGSLTIEFAPVEENCIRLIRDGKVYPIGIPEKKSLVVSGENAYLSLTNLQLSELMPLCDGDVLVISGEFLCTDEKLTVTIPDGFLLIQGDRSIKESVDSSVIQALLPLLTGSGE